jgi:enoyl-CoA hydratase
MIGRPRATEYLITGRSFSAEQAESWGLINRVVKDRDVVKEALDLAAEIASKPRVAVQAAIESARAGQPSAPLPIPSSLLFVC